MVNHLEPKQTVDKNGKHTTVHVKPEMPSGSTARKLPSGVPVTAAPARPAGSVGGYEIRSYKSLQGRETANFTAKIYKDGKHILDVSNDGNGGPNLYNSVDGQGRGWREEEDAFNKFAQEFNGSDYPEEGSILLDYMVWAAQVEKAADKAGKPRAEVLAYHIDRENAEYRKEGLDYLIIGDELRAKMIAASEATTL